MCGQRSFGRIAVLCILGLPATGAPTHAQAYHPSHAAYQQQLLQQRITQEQLRRQELLQRQQMLIQKHQAHQDALKQQKAAKQQQSPAQQKFHAVQVQQRAGEQRFLKKIDEPDSLTKYGKLSESQATIHTTYDPVGNPVTSKVDMTIYSNYLPAAHFEFNVDLGLLQRIGADNYLGVLERRNDFGGYSDLIGNYLANLATQSQAP